MVSIIIPVYNTKEYLKKCVDSLLAQTYKDIEIILINDGSTDDSIKVCEMYEKTDSRVKVFSQVNSGQGEARNLGISKASGEFIMFVDSDDWVEKNIVEELMNSLTSYEADISICNYYRTRINSEEILGCCEEKISKECLDQTIDKDYVFNITSLICAKLIKTSLIKASAFKFPKHFFEDVSAMPLLFAYANKISYVNKPLYYYRNHTASTVNTLSRVDDRIKCLYSLVDIFKEHGLFERYRIEMQQYMKRRLKINSRMVKHVLYLYKNDFNKRQNCFYKEQFEERDVYKLPNILSFGSYNLYTITKILMNSDPDEVISDFYGFQSIVSLMNKKSNDLNYVAVEHPVAFRKKAIINDFTNKLGNKSVVEFEDIDYILIDFLEERYDVAFWKENYFTLSDAFKEAQVLTEMNYEIISRDSEEMRRIWERSCDEFINLLKRLIDPHKIILVRMKLSEHYGQVGKEEIYPEVEVIRKVNDLLDSYYDYFMKQCPEAQEIANFEDEPFYYTFSQFRHGCYPWHLSQPTYSEISRLIEEKLGGFTGKEG